GALEILRAKKNIRLMEIPSYPPLTKGGGSPACRGRWPEGSEGAAEGDLDFKKITGGLLIQDRDRIVEEIRGSKVVTKRSPTKEEWDAMEFAWKVVKHLKSNAIVIATRDRTVGIGAGQMSRVDSVKIAIKKMGVGAGSPRPGAVTAPLQQPLILASDAFFPFRDNVDEAAKAGVKAIIQPGGSVKDQESIDAADEHQIAMVFTGVRHFRH
ncbi:MAG: hypothetical protein HY542_03690, partial [Deltaproteobacteria bacterium]|nr:hypothetical protein [Deltaproteobacteria bacterium]